jgi:chemotaxis protein methyltransferase CheR
VSAVSDELSRASGLALDAYRSEHVAECLRRALSRERVATAAELAGLIARDPAARVRFRRSVAVSVSGLFRDPAQFELLERELLPPLLAGKRRLNVWSAGCADGSELYSLATLLDRVCALERSFLLGSDVLEENVAAARRRQLEQRLSTRVRFERRDVVRDGAPSGRWRLVLCRNLAIYLGPAAKEALYELLAAALARDGVLLLGRSERLVKPARFGLEQAGRNAYRRRP